jgi:hypothetical protein
MIHSKMSTMSSSPEFYWPTFRPYKKNVVFLLTRLTPNFSPNPINFIGPLKKKSNLFQKYRTHLCISNQCKDIGQFCMCTEALWIQEIKPLFNSMKILIIVLEFAMCSLKLEIKLKKKINFWPSTTLFFFHNVNGNTTFFLYGLTPYWAFPVT